MKKRIFETMFILSNIAVACASVKLIIAAKKFNDTINEIEFSKIRANMCSIMEECKVRKDQ